MPKEKAAEAAFFVGNVFSKEFRSRNGSLFKRYIHVAFFSFHNSIIAQKFSRNFPEFPCSFLTLKRWKLFPPCSEIFNSIFILHVERYHFRNLIRMNASVRNYIVSNQIVRVPIISVINNLTKTNNAYI